MASRFGAWDPSEVVKLPSCVRAIAVSGLAFGLICVPMRFWPGPKVVAPPVAGAGGSGVGGTDRPVSHGVGGAGGGLGGSGTPIVPGTPVVTFGGAPGR